jgi:ATP-dependent Clp protease, protease subunit
MTIPFVIEKKGNNERVYDVYSRLLEDRIIFIGDEISDDLANSIVAQLLLLDQQDSTRDIKLYINSYGGSITSGMAIYDTMRYVKSEVATVCLGVAASMAAVLLAAGTKGKRLALPNSRIMIHEPRHYSGPNSRMTTSEQIIDTQLIVDMRDQLAGILSTHTGQQEKKIKRDTRQDFWFKPEQALEYGLIDSIVVECP